MTPRTPTKQQHQRVNLDLPVALLEAIDAESDAIGVTRTAWIKVRLADWLEQKRKDSGQ